MTRSDVSVRQGVGRPVVGGARLAAAGGILGALAATACCIVPLVLFTLGAGGIWVGRLASLAPYQPYFIGFALVSIGFGFWQVYGRSKAACTDGAACARPLPRRLVKAALCSATVLVLAAILYPYVVPYIL
ncbi:MAG: mercuric transporter MerT family protein [Alphaproteobacteria bacterium]